MQNRAEKSLKRALPNPWALFPPNERQLQTAKTAIRNNKTASRSGPKTPSVVVPSLLSSHPSVMCKGSSDNASASDRQTDSRAIHTAPINQRRHIPFLLSFTPPMSYLPPTKPPPALALLSPRGPGPRPSTSSRPVLPCHAMPYKASQSSQPSHPKKE
ncbi:hypothetical protein FRC14_007835 [Serendipita sp. 396]|nr:hypothetical protein FRC14_007835 [Serendipita sp. 396]